VHDFKKPSVEGFLVLGGFTNLLLQLKKVINIALEKFACRSNS
jgi:hypothetical protein